jgi:nucleoside-diphosphate-sugar epimerase
LAEDCFKNGVERFIGIGSMTEYGTKNHSKFYEQISEMPIDSYSHEKIETCREISKLSLSYRKNFQWLRIFQAFGKGEKRERFIPSLIEALFNETQFLIGTPENVLDWIHIDEISTAIFHSVANIDLQVIDVGTGLGQSVLDVSRKICTIGGFDSSLIKYSSQDPRLRKELVVSETSPLLKSGWRPEKSLEIHLEEMFDQKINS